MLIRAVVRAFAVFDCFDSEAQRLTLHEICQRLDLPKSTVFRLLNTLVQIGYLVQLEDQSYCVSFKVLRLGNLIPSTLQIRDIAKSELRSLGKITNETVSINIMEGRDRIVLDVVESPSKLRSIVRIGEVVGLQSGAVGRVFLAFHSEPLIDTVFGKGQVPATLDAELAQVRIQGYACSTGDRVPGSSGIAAPIFDIKSDCSFCMSIAGPEARITENREMFAEMLLASTKRISRYLGCPENA